VGSPGTATQAEVERFLNIFKSCWDGNVVPRTDTKNDDTLSILGITPRHRAEEIKRLRYENYFRGPSPDHDGNPDKHWWEFGRVIDGYEIYIKIRVYERKDGSFAAKCMSFHIAEWPISYPPRKEV